MLSLLKYLKEEECNFSFQNFYFPNINNANEGPQEKRRKKKKTRKLSVNIVKYGMKEEKKVTGILFFLFVIILLVNF